MMSTKGFKFVVSVIKINIFYEQKALVSPSHVWELCNFIKSQLLFGSNTDLLNHLNP